MEHEFLSQLRTKKELRLKELVLFLSELIPLLIKKQTRYKVSELPDERTIRYYITQGLIDKPAYYKGRHAVFTNHHVLQILIIKYLQSNYLPLKKIFEVMKKSNDHDLENILFEGNEEAFLGIALNNRNLPVNQLHGLKPLTCTVPPPLQPLLNFEGTSWRRFRIHNKVELYVEESFDIFNEDLDIRTTSAKMMEVLFTFGDRNKSSQRVNNRDTGFELDDDDLGYERSAFPLKNLSGAVIALVTEGGLVPKGNPDRLESARSNRYLKYQINGITDLKSSEFESIDRGWDTSYVNEDPDRLLPVDIMRELEQSKMFYKLSDFFYTTTGAGTSVDHAKKIGKKIASELKKEGVSAVILTST
jgi:DNA-binding transcriptional MerR regulator